MLTRFFLPVLLAFMVLFAGCSSSGQDDHTISADVVNNPNSAVGSEKGSLPIITFEEDEHDFGRILEGETVACEFTFTNTGKSDLIIAEVSTSCGCTVPSYSKLPIRPGDTGTIKVTFNSNGRRGIQSKNVLVVANTQPNTTLLRIKAQVVNPASQQ